MAAKKKTNESVLIENYLTEAKRSIREELSEGIIKKIKEEAKWNKGYQDALIQLVNEITGITEELNEEVE